jgi:hypothetical protein
MKNPLRITIAMDDESLRIFNELKGEFRLSQSEVVRRALRFYHALRELENYSKETVMTYVEMLSGGEHVILDIDHWIAFLRFIETHPEKEKFWEVHRDVARAHAEEFEGKNIDYILKRLEACNFFRVSTRGDEYTLVLSNEATRRFIREFLEELFRNMGMKVEIREDIMKLRIKFEQ